VRHLNYVGDQADSTDMSGFHQSCRGTIALRTSGLGHVSQTAFILLALLTDGCQLSSSKESYLERGNALATNGKYDEAALQYRKAIQKDPRYGEAYFRLGGVFVTLNKPEEAHSALSQAVELMPGSEEAKVSLGRIALSKLIRSPQRPLILYQTVDKISKQLLQANRNSFEGLRLRGFLAMMDSQSIEAIDSFRKALKAKPDDPEITTVLVQNLLADKQDAEAETLARESLTSIKNYGALYDTLYSVYINSGRAVEAERLLKLKIANNPGQAFYVVQLAEHYLGQKKTKEAQDLLNDLTADEKGYPGAKLDVGDYYRRCGRLEEAAVLFQKGLDSDRDHSKEYLQRLSGIRIEQGRAQEASAILDTIIKETPDNSEAQSSRASLRMATGKPEEMKKALETFTSLVQQKPDNAQFRFLLARAYRELGQTDKARAALSEILKLNPGDRQALREMADIAIRAQRADEAMRYAERLIEINPNDISTRLVRTAAWALQRRFNDVRGELRRITQEYPDMPEAWLQMATLNIEEKHYAEAERILLRFYQPGKNILPALRRLVTLYILQGQPQKSLALVREEAKHSDNPEIRILLASTATQAGDLELALATVQRLSSDFPLNPEHWTALGDIYLRKNMTDQAIASFQKAQQVAPTDPLLSARLGSTLGQAGRYQEAVTVYRQSLQQKPDDPLLMNNLAWHIALSGSNFDEAIALSQKALQKEPENLQYADTLGMIYLKLNKLDNALPALRGIVRKEPTNPEFRTHLAMVLIAQDQPGKAKAELEIALKSHPSALEERQIVELLRSLP